MALAIRLMKIINGKWYWIKAHVKGNWSEAADSGAEIWFRTMAEAGLKKFAWNYSPSTFSRIAANKSLPSKYDAVQLAFFDN